MRQMIYVEYSLHAEDEEKGAPLLWLTLCVLSSYLPNHPRPHFLACRDTFFKDNEILEQIDKDVQRLCPEFAFYKGISPFPRRKLLLCVLRLKLAIISP